MKREALRELTIPRNNQITQQSDRVTPENFLEHHNDASGWWAALVNIYEFGLHINSFGYNNLCARHAFYPWFIHSFANGNAKRCVEAMCKMKLVNKKNVTRKLFQGIYYSL